jgi:hypothetical protein
VLLPSIPTIVGPYLPDLFEIFNKLASFSVKRPRKYILKHLNNIWVIKFWKCKATSTEISIHISRYVPAPVPGSMLFPNKPYSVEKLIANSMDPDQTARMHRLVWIHASHKRALLVLSWCGANSFCFLKGTDILKVLQSKVQYSFLPVSISGLWK